MVVLRKELLGPQPILEVEESPVTGQQSTMAMRLRTIDIGGQLLFLISFSLIVLALTWGGVAYAWNSAAVLASLVIGLVLVAAFLLWEHELAPNRRLNRVFRAQRPLLPWHLLSNRDIGLLFYTECANGVGMYAVSFLKTRPKHTDPSRCCISATSILSLSRYVGHVLAQHTRADLSVGIRTR